MYAQKSGLMLGLGYAATTAGLLLHALTLWSFTLPGEGLSLSIGNIASLIGLQLAVIAWVGAFQPRFRGMAAGLLLLAAVAGDLTGWRSDPASAQPLAWQLQMHVLLSLFAYALLTAGAIVAVFALIQERRLRAGQLSSINQLFAPLETTEKMLFGVSATGFLVLLLAVSSGFALFENLFAQHLVHKTVLSLLALTMFGVLLAGRQFAGWRGKRAVYLYLWGFFILGLAYFGSRIILESVLGRSWH
jgi:ABC-type uncharacterized transport system permease subunit